MTHRPGTRQLRLALVMLPLVFMLAGAPPGEAGPAPGPQSSQAPHSSHTPAGAGPVIAGAAAGVTVPAAVASAMTAPAAAAQTAPVNDGREDLTVFFTIGAILDVLLVVAFLIWATGQWRKVRK